MDDLRKELTEKCSRQVAAAGLVLAAVFGCTRADANPPMDSARADSVARAVRDSINRAQPGYVVDSIFPTDEEIRRFNAGLERPAQLTGGGANRGDLVRLFTTALAERDTSSLRQLLVTRAEFGYLVFPESPYTRPPYKTKPGIIWLQLMSETERGLARLLQRVAGDSTRLTNLACDPVPERQGPNLYWRQCSMQVEDAQGRSRRLRLFGQILEREGRAKFLSYATAF